MRVLCVASDAVRHSFGLFVFVHCQLSAALCLVFASQVRKNTEHTSSITSNTCHFVYRNQTNINISVSF